MKIGIIPNITKPEIFSVVETVIDIFEKNQISYFLDDSICISAACSEKIRNSKNLMSREDLISNSNTILSIGGDGTMLNTAYEARHAATPMMGLNMGKLGFLAEYEIGSIEQLIEDLKNKTYKIENRMALEAECKGIKSTELFAINDIVIDRGKYPKMIELTLFIDDDYVTTFSADGLIIATPTGTTGYSLSTGGPIVSPGADAITLSPISPHTLTMRPLVLSSDQIVKVKIESSYEGIQVNCDGQRVNYMNAPLTIEISKSDIPVKLLHTQSNNYFKTLRNKLYWGIDVRNNSQKI